VLCTETGARPRAEETDVVTNLVERAREHVEGAGRLDDRVVRGERLGLGLGLGLGPGLGLGLGL